MAQEKKQTTKERCAFCGKETNYYFHELGCYICPECLGKYEAGKAGVDVRPYWEEWQTGDSITFSDI